MSAFSWVSTAARSCMETSFCFLYFILDWVKSSWHLFESVVFAAVIWTLITHILRISFNWLAELSTHLVVPPSQLGWVASWIRLQLFLRFLRTHWPWCFCSYRRSSNRSWSWWISRHRILSRICWRIRWLDRWIWNLSCIYRRIRSRLTCSSVGCIHCNGWSCGIPCDNNGMCCS